MAARAEEGGGQGNRAGRPARQAAAGSNQHLGSCKETCCVVFMITFVILFVSPYSIYLAIIGYAPLIVSELSSFSISPSNSSSAAASCHIVVPIRKDSLEIKNVHIKTGTALVYYRDQVVWSSSIKPFDLVRQHVAEVRLNMSATLPPRLAADMELERSRKGTLTFFVSLRGEGLPQSQTRKTTVDIFCWGFEVGFSSSDSATAAAQLVSSPIPCDAKIDTPDWFSW